MLKVRDKFQELADDIKSEVKRLMDSPLGVNPKTGKNTLTGSKLQESVDVTYNGENTLTFQIAEYAWNVIGGRKPGWGTPPPTGFIDAIFRWVREKGIRFEGRTETQTCWAIIKSIVNNGIAPRPFLGNGYYTDDPAEILPFLDDMIDSWMDKIFEDILKELDKYFNS